MEATANNENARAGAELVADIYVMEPVKKTGPWMNVSGYKKATVWFMNDSQYYDTTSQELGSFELNIKDIIYQAQNIGISVFTRAILIGMGNAQQGNKCIYCRVEVDSTYSKIKISAPTPQNPGIFGLKVVFDN